MDVYLWLLNQALSQGDVVVNLQYGLAGLLVGAIVTFVAAVATGK